MNKGEVYHKHITSRKWRELRKRHLSQFPLCEECERNNFIRSATEVHHKRPVETMTSAEAQQLLMFDPDNLMSVCHECHVKIHMSLGKNTKEDHKERAENETKTAIELLYGDTPGGSF